MEFGLLGAVTVTRDGHNIPVDGEQRRFVLATLLLDTGRIVAVDRMIDGLWAESVPKTARNVVQGCVAALRRTLGLTVVHKAPGYLLEVDPRTVDVFRFRELVARAREDDDPALFREALGLWRGEPLADVPGLAAIKHALAEERLTALEECIELETRLGHDVVPELTRLVDAHPLRERLYELLMFALRHAGRPGEALQVYENARIALRDELGADPGPRLRRVHADLLREPATAVVPRQLPLAPDSFTGRERELSSLTGATIAVISGLGGVGKTWLAARWAHRHRESYPDGQLFVNLGGFDAAGGPMAAEVAVRGFLDALGVEAGAVPVEPHAQAALYRSLVSGKRMLVVLDNARDVAHVVPLLPESPTCTVLITSRDRMHGLVATRGARATHLGVLSDEESLELLVRRLGADRVAREPGAVAELLACCAGLPLALGIVAGQALSRPDFPLSALAAELGEARLTALDTGDPSSDLTSVLATSYAALSPKHAKVFDLLGQAPGADVGLVAAANLCGLDLADAAPHSAC